MKDKSGLLSPLFLKYQSEYEKNPRSKVFAPLAEMYRKIGMTEKAMEILGQGIKYHPSYSLGYLGMASCYFDIQQYSLAYSALRPLVDSNRDNLKLLRLFADTCMKLGNKDEALETYKYLLFILPKDKEIASIVSVLEDQIYEEKKPSFQPILIPENNILNQRIIPSVEKKNFLNDPDSWTQLPLNENKKQHSKIDSIDPLDWEMQKTENLNLDVQTKTETESDLKIVLDFEKPSENNNSTFKAQEQKEELPFITHTLVDLYIGQGHIEKALELLEKILLLNPNDQKTHEKILEIKELVSNTFNENDSEKNNEFYNESTIHIDELLKPVTDIKVDEKVIQNEKRAELNSEEEGHAALMNELSHINLDQINMVESILTNSDDEEQLKEIIAKKEFLLNSFLQKIKIRAMQMKSI